MCIVLLLFYLTRYAKNRDWKRNCKCKLQSNFAPVEEIGEAVKITSIEGEIPNDFPEGIYIRNGMGFYSVF